jgi:hypothetical protein
MTPAVFAKFQKTEILGEMGRLLFSLLNAFSVSGYHISLFDSLPAEALDKYGRRACALDGVTLTREYPTATDQTVYVFDREDPALAARKWLKKVEIRFDVFSPYWFRRPLIMPYPVHPVHTGPDLPERLRRHRDSTKKMRVFFSGDREGYVNNRIRYPKPKLPRQEVIDSMLQGMGERATLVRGERELEEVCSAGYVDRCLIMDQHHSRIDETRWLATLATADFFLCPPGYVMPMCHNTVEAMAVGAIPIINYPEWFDPHLVHLETCIAFDDRADLIDNLEQVLRMDTEQIVRMREQVIAYYDRHLAPETFVRRLESDDRSRIVVLMITDANVSKNASKLNGRSVLMRGTPRSGAGLVARLRLS